MEIRGPKRSVAMLFSAIRKSLRLQFGIDPSDEDINSFLHKLVDNHVEFGLAIDMADPEMRSMVKEDMRDSLDSLFDQIGEKINDSQKRGLRDDLDAFVDGIPVPHPSSDLLN